MKDFKKKLFELLKDDSRLWNEDKKELNETLLKDLVDKLDEKLIELFLSDKDTKEKLFIKVKDVFVLKQNDLKFFIDENKLDNSYTQYQDKIGLRVGNKLLSERDEVVLDWPFKDCVLEGGMTKEDQKRNEIFFNEILAKDEIDRLEDPKVLVNWKRYTAKGEEKVKELKRDKDGTIRENLIIKGNNLLALHSLKEQFTGKVKMIYIDPPYYFSDTKAGDTFIYNTNFKLSSWLVFMKNRLTEAKELLTKDGSIFIQISDDGLGYLRCLLDDIFKPENFLNIISVQAKSVAGASGGGEDKKLKKNTEFIILYCKDHLGYSPNKVYKEIPLKFLIEDKQREGKEYEYKQILLKAGKRKEATKIQTGDGEDVVVYKHIGFEISSVRQVMAEKSLDTMAVYEQYYDKIFRTHDAQSSIRHKVVEVTDKNGGLYSIGYYPRSGKNKGKLTTNYYYKNELVGFLTNTSIKKDGEIIKRREVGSLWDDIGWDGIAGEGGVKLKSGKKPERLIRRIIDLSTEHADLVMDYHLGSGTTCAVAHKMSRQYIGIEQLDYEENDGVARLKNVINGDTTGISKLLPTPWQGGGDFIYLELAKWNEEAKEKVLKAKSLSELIKLFDELYERYFLNYNVKTKEFEEKTLKEEEFKKLSLNEQKKLFVEMLDMNQMYVNFSERADKKYNLSKEDIALSEEFYNSK